MHSALEERARAVVMKLRSAGFEAYFAGGCVRDRLLGIEPIDFDIATSARPDDVQKTFRRTVGVGKNFGVMVVLSDDFGFQVATFRSDGAYTDGRHPDAVTFATAREDVERRDFTINGMLFDPATETVIDWVGGQADLAAGLVRTIGDPEARFTEDRLRLLRAVRFAARLGFSIEATTAAAVRRLAGLAVQPSPERVGDEIRKMFTERDPAGALRLLHDLGLLAVVMPEVAAKATWTLSRRLRASDASPADALSRTSRLLAAAPGDTGLECTLAVLLEDTGDRQPGGAAEIAMGVLRRLRFRNDEIRLVGDLVRVRDRLLFATRTSPGRRRLVAASPDLGHMRALWRLERREAGSEAVDRLEPKSEALPPPLLRGDRLLALGVPGGKRIGAMLRRMRLMQLDGTLESEAAAETWVKERLARQADR